MPTRPCRQYGTYNANDAGTRVDQANPGFPILGTYQGTSYYGFANYWGINFQGLAIPDGSPASGLTVTDQRPGNTTSYALNKARRRRADQVDADFDDH